MKRIYILLVALTAVLGMNAQFAIGPRVGIAVNSLHFNEKTFDADNRAGFTGGLQVEFTAPVIGIGFDASVMYVRRNSQFLDTETNTTENADRDYIEIPINLKYKLGLPLISKIVTPYVFTGPSFAFLTSRRAIDEFWSSQKSSIAWNFGFGVQLIKHLQVGASYGIGLNKAVKAVGGHNTTDIEGKNSYWTITAAWLF